MPFLWWESEDYRMANTLRLLMPQWQGGNNPPYSFGAKLLAWLAPSCSDSPVIEVPVEPYNGTELPIEGGVVAKSMLLNQLMSATKIIETHQPDKIVMFGGDCLVSQAPFSYLNEKYNGNLGVLWLDAHPDVSTPDMFNHAHAMVLGNLLGEGDRDFASHVKVPLKPELVMYGGLQETTEQEKEIINRLNIRRAGAHDLSTSSAPVIEWLQKNEIKQLAIHLDLDVLNPTLFRSLLFANPDPNAVPIDAPSGDMSLQQLSRLIQDVEKHTEIVGLGVAEYFPWDAMNLRDFLETLPIFK